MAQGGEKFAWAVVILLISSLLGASEGRSLREWENKLKERLDRLLRKISGDERDDTDIFDKASLKPMPKLTECQGSIFGIDHIGDRLYVGCTSPGDNSIHVYDAVNLNLIEKIKIPNIPDAQYLDGLEGTSTKLTRLFFTARLGDNSIQVYAIDMASDKAHVPFKWLANVDSPGYVAVTFTDQVFVSSNKKVDLYAAEAASAVRQGGFTIPVQVETLHDVLPTSTGNAVIIYNENGNKEHKIISVDPSGKIVSSYKAAPPNSPDIILAKSVEDIDVKNLFVGNSGGLYIVKSDLSGGRLLLKGSENGITLPERMSFHPGGGILVVSMASEKEVRAYKLER